MKPRSLLTISLARFRSFLTTSTIGGISIALPVVIITAAFSWLFNIVRDWISPIVIYIENNSSIYGILANIVAFSLIISTFFLLGILVRTRGGKLIHNNFNEILSKTIPGYTAVKETVSQIIGTNETTVPFKEVVLAQPFENGAWLTGFVTAKHDIGLTTVFLPTAPVPGSGYSYHLASHQIIETDISIDAAMRSVIACGIGSEDIVKKIEKNPLLHKYLNQGEHS